VGLEVGGTLEEVLLLARRVLRPDLAAVGALDAQAPVVLCGCREREERVSRDSQRDG
jgi:hypothetical protein